ncbi:MAG: T9SS type A sorting domain-containing protein, partial [Chitinophagaceae bacterium]|nr:T9SS type A sorting domain-containing protein [Chitinophagaceae bacterium]
MKEYRKGKYIGYTTHDFIVTCVSSSPGNKLSIPEPATRKYMNTYTCPGRKNYLSLNFIDPASADSVYMNITTPSIPGFSFNTTGSNGVGSANGSISWTTPLSMNPSTLTFFDIAVLVRDNACKQKGKATYIYRVNTRECSADSVWPGDANTDKVVDMYDPLAIAMNYNDTGSARPNAATTWAAQYCQYWDGSFLNNIDVKHADCNGDGMIDTADLAVVDSNYSKTHPKGGAAQKTTAGPDLYFDHSGIHPNPDSTVSIKMFLGNANTPVSDFYGLATHVLVDGLSLATPPVIKHGSNWIGDSTNTLNFTKEVSATSVDWALARTNKLNVNGQGWIADLEFKIPANTASGTLVTLSYNNTKIIDKEGLDKFEFNTLTDTFYVWQPVYISNVNNSISKLRLYPNPSDDKALLSFHSPQPCTISICVTDMTGRILESYNNSLQKGDNTIQLSAGTLPPGLYLVKVSSIDAGFAETLKWIRR